MLSPFVIIDFDGGKYNTIYFKMVIMIKEEDICLIL